MLSQDGIVPALRLYLSSYHTQETLDSPHHRILTQLQHDIVNDSLPPPASPPPPPLVPRSPLDQSSVASEFAPPSSPFASDLAFPASALSSEDEKLLLSLSSSQLSALTTALEWLLAELRQHLEDESDMRLTAMLQSIGVWSAIKDAIEERRGELEGQQRPARERGDWNSSNIEGDSTSGSRQSKL